MFTKIIYINLDRRPDRNEHVKKELKKINFNGKIERISAVDGKNIDLNNVDHLFSQRTINEAKVENPKFVNPGSFMTRGAMGCALSHRNAYINILNGNDDKVLILEDDIIVDDNFNEKIKEYLKHISDYDMLYLGYHNEHYGSIQINDYYIKPANIVYGLFAYIIDKRIADKLLNMFPIDRQIDSDLSKVYSKINVFILNKDKDRCIITSQDSLNNKLGTDIQILPNIEYFIDKEDTENANMQNTINLLIGLIIIFVIIFLFNKYVYK